MPKNYILRNVDDQLWRDIKSQSAIEGVSMKAWILKQLAEGLKTARAMAKIVQVRTK